MQEFYDFAYPLLNQLEGNVEDEFYARLEMEQVDRDSAQANFATFKDSIAEYREFLADLNGKKGRLTKEHAAKIKLHLTRITNSLERVSDRLSLSSYSKEHLSNLVHDHHVRVNACLSNRLK